MNTLITGGSGFIGTHMMERFLNEGLNCLSIDLSPPKINSHSSHWIKCDILDLQGLGEIFHNYQPARVIHLAARAVMQGKSIDDFKENTLGTANVLQIVADTPSVVRLIVASTQHVRKPGSGLPVHDQDFDPLMLYGESKVITEELTRSKVLNCIWTIVRPTNVWGPWHPNLPDGLWRLIKKGMYLHPSGEPVIRSYCYIRNAVWQIEKMLNAPAELVNRKIFYVGELPSDQYEWVNGFSRALTGRDVRIVPRWMIRLMAFVGDLLGVMGISFPMYSSRYRNLTTSNYVDVLPTYEAFGAPPCTMEEGISETVSWLNDYWTALSL